MTGNAEFIQIISLEQLFHKPGTYYRVKTL